MTNNNNNNNNNNDSFEERYKYVTDLDAYYYYYNDRTPSCCDNCGIIFYTNAVPSIYEITIKKPINLVLCENCYLQIHKEHQRRGQKWEGIESWKWVIEDPELK